MPAWKVLVIFFLGMLTLILGLCTILVPLSMSPEDGRWMYFGGFLFGFIAVTTGLTMFLRHADKTYHKTK
ncbi:MAG: hypothetical protein ACKO23_04280 [Gemmataceae bacterium]